MNKQELNEKIQDKVFHFTEVLNGLVSSNDNTYIPKTVKQIDKLVNNLYSELYSLTDNKKLAAIEDNKCGHCG